MHNRYLSALVSQSFLDIGSVSRILDSIMKLCLQFCWSIEQYETRPNISEIDHITEVLCSLLRKKKKNLKVPVPSIALACSTVSVEVNHTSFLPWFHDNQEFNKKSNSLYTILRSSRLAGSQRAPFLRQFLMRLNFNSFFEVTYTN